MPHSWRTEAQWLLAILLPAALLGYLKNLLWPTLTAVLLLALLWQLWQMHRLQRLLLQDTPTPPAPPGGLWESLFRTTQRLQQRSLRHRQQLQALLSRIQDSTDALQEGILMLDSHGNLEWWNLAASRQLGLKRPADTGQPLTNLVREPQFSAYLKQADFREPLIMAAPHASKRQLQISITAFGRHERLLVIQDVTRLRQLEQMRKDFVANVSHELRTPLTVLSGYIETLQDLSAELPPRWQRILQQMSEQSGRMDVLIKDLLMLSRLETTRQEPPQWLDLNALLEQILRDARALAASKHQQVELQADAPLQILGYPGELRSAFSNLAFNACKYTPDGGHIVLSWQVLDNGCGVFAVQDNGMGIEAQHIPRLTERFYRADPSRSKATGGTGLGLAIVKHVLLRHDATLEITSTPGTGSCFRCVFPASRWQTGKQLTGPDQQGYQP
ncbi:phosphate regulon sensor histidine kinase PhoR [Venatoribacter cucullus]|uniref:Phosphate regulon sensor protein PhoR n=1 Tax=Venatoribacter cucullus TaxID=2661630 RepID=A0A9X7YMV3_9GAMM|nr:phosphate regulon sensor histidine kinase PhoR [Venatoribacter cucullus]QQD23056.1 phosphate regulon sensor histidine kinase PhoR [Venatoribacter cucullus]